MTSPISIFSAELIINRTLALGQLTETTFGNPDINNEVIFVTEGQNT